MKRKAINVSITILLILSCITSSLFIAKADTANAAVQENSDVVVESFKNTNSYASYFSKYSDAEYSSNDLVCNLDGVTLDETLEFNINVEKDGLYAIGMSYKALEQKLDEIRMGLKIDGEYLYSNMEKLTFPRMWCDDNNEIGTDELGNEYIPEQVIYTDYYYFEAYDETLQAGEKFLVYLTAGQHKVTLLQVSGSIQIEYFKFAACSSTPEYVAPTDKSKNYNGDRIIIEAEDATIKSSYFFVGSSDRTSIEISPRSIEKTIINYIGNNWSSIGDTLVWETPELEAGYYQLGFTFRQNALLGAKSYRSLKIDGKSPFSEAESIGFKYGDTWQESVFADDEGTPYLVYLSAGKHQISMSVTAADMAIVRTKLTEAVAGMSDLYVDITKITGETVDIYRDYDLFRQIGDMEERLTAIKQSLEEARDALVAATGEKSGSNQSVVINMLRTIGQMLDEKYIAHRYKDQFYNNYCSVSSVLSDLCKVPLVVDKLILASPEKEVFEEIGFFDKIVYSTKRFFYSFVADYDVDSDDESNGEKSITLWVNWGRDQTQSLRALISRKFTPKSGIKVNLKLANASIIQALLSGKGPDVVLQQGQSEPVNLAMRGVLYDLTNFADYKQVLENFQEGAETPYWYKGGLYALPDTQTFNMMFYRKDILAEYNIKIPETWDDFALAAKLLMRNNMNVCLPGGTSTDSFFPTLLVQNGLELYADDGRSTNMLTSEAAEIFEEWTNYYSKLKVPITMDFYNRFRTGTTPLGVSGYTLYTTLKVAAPEIEGLWGFTIIPATVRDDGTLSHASLGSGTGCSILNISKNPEYSWEFLKWWTSSETQISYSNDVETLLGPTGRVAVANKKALENLTWDEGAVDELVAARNVVLTNPEYPGSYYVSRAIYQAFWNVVSNNKNTKDMMIKFGMEANNEIARKWEQYTNRK